ncbi:MAG TPA: hypothetical protein VFG91_04735 [Woeseiaceae bacterium]|nr:hypothetical protein [Woeseiaceae bacterium]
MKGLKVSVITAIALLTAGCGGTPACREPQPYEHASLGQPIKVPEGLDPLDPSREMTIPKPSPRPQRSADSPCLEYPPTFTVDEPEQESEPQPAEPAPEPETPALPE